MRVKNLDLIGAMLIVVINIGWTQLPNRPLLPGIILAVPLLFVLPGYTLTQVLFRKRSPDPTGNLILRPTLRLGQPVGLADDIILSLGLSMAIDVLSGFILNMFPMGLQAVSWAVMLGLLTAIFALVAAYLRHRTPEDRRHAARFHINIYECILLILSMVIVFLAVEHSVISAEQQPRPGFTQLWMVQSKQVHNTCTVLVGVHSFESASTTYSITIMVNGNRTSTWQAVTLAPQREWDQQVSLMPATAETLFVEVQLYRLATPGVVYRDVHLTLHHMKGGNGGYGQQCTI